MFFLTLPDPVAYCPCAGRRLAEFVSNTASESHICLDCWTVYSPNEFLVLVEAQGGRLRPGDTLPKDATSTGLCACGKRFQDMRGVMFHARKCAGPIKIWRPL